MSARMRELMFAVVGVAIGAVSMTFVHAQGAKFEGKLSHIGFAVRDVNKAAKEWADLFGVEVPKTMEVRDVPYGEGLAKKMSVRLVHLNVGGVTLELLQGFSPESLWAEHIAKHGETFNHFAFTVPDIAQARDLLVKGGGKVWMNLTPLNYYVNLEPKYPMMIEISQPPPAAAGAAR